MKQPSLACLLASVVAIAACGGGGAGGGSDQAPQPAASSGSVVPHEQLLALLPTIPEWTLEGSPQGSTDTTEKVSRVQAGYVPAGPDKASGLSIEIMDTAGNPNILGPLRDFIRANKTTQSGDRDVIVTTSPVEVSGYKGMQEWSPGAKNGTLSLLVADRFTVGITANYFSDPGIMRRVAEAIDLKKLASLK